MAHQTKATAERETCWEADWGVGVGPAGDVDVGQARRHAPDRPGRESRVAHGGRGSPVATLRCGPEPAPARPARAKRPVGRGMAPGSSPRRHVAPQPRSPRPGVTRPGRAAPGVVAARSLLALLALMLLVGAARLGGGLGGLPLAAPGPPPEHVEHVVEPGDTLWSIAGQVAPGADPRAVVDELAEAHGPGSLVPGETIVWSP